MDDSQVDFKTAGRAAGFMLTTFAGLMRAHAHHILSSCLPLQSSLNLTCSSHLVFLLAFAIVPQSRAVFAP